MMYPCPLCRAKAQAIMDDATNSTTIRAAESYGHWLERKSKSRSPRERAEHLETVHGWRVRE